MDELEQIMDALAAFIQLGGPVVAALFAVSVIVVAVILMKLYQFWRADVGRSRHAARAVELWMSGRPREAFTHAQTGRSLASRAVASAIDMTIHRQFDKAEIEERLSRQVAERLHDLQAGFRLLDAVAQLAPLLGLFGTVLGMIEAFRQLQSAGNAVDPSLLAGGIWVALLTTAAGLAVAMPVSLVLTWLESRVEDERIAIETLTADILMAGRMVAPPAGVVAGEVVIAH